MLNRPAESLWLFVWARWLLELYAPAPVSLLCILIVIPNFAICLTSSWLIFLVGICIYLLFYSLLSFFYLCHDIIVYLCYFFYLMSTNNIPFHSSIRINVSLLAVVLCWAFVNIPQVDWLCNICLAECNLQHISVILPSSCIVKVHCCFHLF